MNKKIIFVFLLSLFLLFMFGCKNKEVEEVKIDASISNLEIEVGKNNTFSYEANKEIKIKIEDEDIANIEINNNIVNVSGINVGKTKLDFIYNEEVIKIIDIEVIEEVIYLPVPTGTILLKGVDKDASVKVILTKDNLSYDDIIWQMDNDNVVSMQTQGGIAQFHSLARGKVEIKVSIGEYSNSFIIYVTNIRGDID